MNTRRRWLAAGVGLPALAWVDVLHSQTRPPPVIGWLNPNPRGEGRGVRAFVEGMAALGWKVGAQYVLEERYAEGNADRLPALAREIAEAKPAAIVVINSTAASAAAAAAPATPVVVAIGDPLAAGLVSNLARPGGMVTGLSNVSADLSLKSIELLLESAPKLERIGVLADSTTSSHAAIVQRSRLAAQQLRIEAVLADVARPEDIEPAFVRLAMDKAQALVVLPSVWFSHVFPQIIGLAMAQRWPVVGTTGGIARQGGLLRYGPESLALIRRSATYVDRILKGAKPGDLPIEQPTAFELVLNLKTAKTLGIAIPQSIRLRATEVIE